MTTDAARLAAIRERLDARIRNVVRGSCKGHTEDETRKLCEDAAAELTRLSSEVAALEADANLLTDMAQFMDAVKPDLGNQWSVWDQSVRDRITARLRALAASAGGERG
jgi:hypothetical protein